MTSTQTQQRKKTKYEKKGHIAVLTIYNPEKANVMDAECIGEMGSAYRDYWEDREMRCLIVTGYGDRHFSAGHHIQPPPPDVTPDQQFQRSVENFIYPAAQTEQGRKYAVFGGGEDFPLIWKPVIAAINGWAAGAGLYMILRTTDIRLACAEHGRLWYPFTTNLSGIGSGPLAAGIIKQMNYIHAAKFLLEGEPVDAAEAVRIGLVNEAVPHDQLMPRAMQIAEKIASLPPIAVRYLKELLYRAQDMSQDQAWYLQWVYNHLASVHSEDAFDGAKAFLEKRPRRVTGNVHAKL